MSQDPYLSEVFSQPPLTAYKRQKKIRDQLIRAKVPSDPKPYPARRMIDMKRCGKNCSACPYISKVKAWKINQNLNCEIANYIYLIECMKEDCNMKYVGETRRSMKFRLAEHRGYVNNNVDTPTGEHFNLPGHSLSDLRVSILEKVRSKDDMYRKERERYFIRKFYTYYKGLNRQP